METFDVLHSGSAYGFGCAWSCSHLERPQSRPVPFSADFPGRRTERTSRSGVISDGNASFRPVPRSERERLPKKATVPVFLVISDLQNGRSVPEPSSWNGGRERAFRSTRSVRNAVLGRDWGRSNF